MFNYKMSGYGRKGKKTNVCTIAILYLVDCMYNVAGIYKLIGDSGF